MRASKLLLCGLFTLLRAAITPHVIKQSIEARAQKVQWGPCDLNLTVSAECASLPVPLDYLNPNSSTTVDIELLRISATSTPSKGSILFNPGGPGDDGRTFVASEQKFFLSATGGNYDLIGFNPRGVGETLPLHCSNNTSELSALSNLVGAGYTSTIGQLWGYGKVLSNACYVNDPQLGSLVGTAYVVRDMMQIVDALDNDGLLRYWGFSYGSALGATAALMFPDKIDKIIIDGVVNTREYYHGFALDNFSDADAIFTAFCFACVSNPTICAVARGRSALELQELLYSLFDDLKYNPIPITTSTGGFLVDYDTVKVMTIEMLYRPELMPNTSAIYDGLLTGNHSAVIAYMSTPASETSQAAFYAVSSLYSILCGDKYRRASSPADVALPIANSVESSRIIGDAGNGFITVCTQWKFAAKERYNGNFTAKTKNPMLLISNTWDPVTPLKSARNVSTYFEGSVVLEQRGYGHTSFSQGSLCTTLATRAYFTNGTLPEPETVCDVDVTLFSPEGTGRDQVIAQLTSQASG